MDVQPFEITVSQDVIADLQARLRGTRWPEAATVDDWQQGVPLDVLQDLCAYWADGFDWRASEKRLNGHPGFATEIDGLSIHFLHVRSPEADARPLVLTHGWPGSIAEFLDVIGPLTDPQAHGGDPADAFHLVVPALPGYGWSGKPTATGWNVTRTAEAWRTLMTGLGYDRFLAQGGDWGSRVTTELGARHPDVVAGIHINMPSVGPPPGQTEFDEAERAALSAMARYRESEAGYATVQSTRPQTVGYGLTDSPAGLCAWILEKLYFWADVDADPVRFFGADRILENITIYWVTNTAASSARYYWENLRTSRYWKDLQGSGNALAVPVEEVAVPSGVSMFPKELFSPPRHWVERQYTDLRYWNELPRGGHFAALEQPGVFVDELRACFRLVR
jgi:pimeloyl-ACP methyl ester carboxylesterase